MPMRTRVRPSPRAAAPKVRFARTRRVYRSRGFAAFSVLLLVAIAAAGVWVALWGTDPGDAPRAAAPDAAPRSTPAPAEPSTSGTAGCPALPFEDQSQPVDGPAAVWRPVGPSPSAAATPAALDVGPVPDQAGVSRCYARTPTGALFAGANFLAVLSDPTTVEDGLLNLTVDGEGQQHLWLLYGFEPSAVIGTGGAYDVAGFRFLSSALDTVAVAVVLRGGNGGLTAVPLTLVWDEGTWLVRVPDDGSFTARSQPLASLDGYAGWQAR